MNSLMELVDQVQERKCDCIADSRGEKNYALWQQLAFRLDYAFCKITVLAGIFWILLKNFFKGEKE